MVRPDGSMSRAVMGKSANLRGSLFLSTICRVLPVAGRDRTAGKTCTIGQLLPGGASFDGSCGIVVL
jgi:hypothetical protein